MNTYLDTVSKMCDGVSSPNQSTQEFIKKVATEWAAMADQRHIMLPHFVDASDALQALACLIDNHDPDGDNIEDFLGAPISFGAFKECYPWTDKYVIKFCAMKNPTIDEQLILLRAAEQHVSHYFVPSCYLQLPRAIDSRLLDKDDDDAEVYNPETGRWEPNPHWVDDTILTHICIQPLVQPLGESDENNKEFSRHERDWARMVETIPQLKEESPDDWFGLAGACLNWVRDFGYYYGKVGLTTLRDFCETFGIWDLHSENVGHLIPSVSGRGAPVILDWMSR